MPRRQRYTGVPFDPLFDTDSSLYCTEFVRQAVNVGLGTNLVGTTQCDGRRIVTLDDVVFLAMFGQKALVEWRKSSSTEVIGKPVAAAEGVSGLSPTVYYYKWNPYNWDNPISRHKGFPLDQVVAIFPHSRLVCVDNYPPNETPLTMLTKDTGADGRTLARSLPKSVVVKSAKSWIAKVNASPSPSNHGRGKLSFRVHVRFHSD